MELTEIKKSWKKHKLSQETTLLKCQKQKVLFTLVFPLAFMPLSYFVSFSIDYLTTTLKMHLYIKQIAKMSENHTERTVCHSLLSFVRFYMASVLTRVHVYLIHFHKSGWKVHMNCTHVPVFRRPRVWLNRSENSLHSPNELVFGFLC